MRIDGIEIKDLDVYLEQCALLGHGYYYGKLDGDRGPITRAARAAWEDMLDGKIHLDYLGIQLDRWHAARVPAEKEREVRVIVERILYARARYEAVAVNSGVPWFVIAGLHNMESGGNFNCHLHEGSPLTGRTKYVPKGRPLTGSPPFTWEFSALDALAYDKLAAVDWSSLPHLLYACEKYNGLGYLLYHTGTPTPYLWAGTTVERDGKYYGDRQWSPTARSKQIGIVAILKALQAGAHVVLPG